MSGIKEALLEHGCTEAITIDDEGFLTAAYKDGVGMLYSHDEGDPEKNACSSIDNILEGLHKQPEVLKMLQEYFAYEERPSFSISQVIKDEDDVFLMTGYMPFRGEKHGVLLPVSFLIDKRLTPEPMILFGGYEYINWLPFLELESRVFLLAMKGIQLVLAKNVKEAVEGGKFMETPVSHRDLVLAFMTYLEDNSNAEASEATAALCSILFGQLGLTKYVSVIGRDVKEELDVFKADQEATHTFVLAVEKVMADAGGILAKVITEDGHTDYYGFLLQKGSFGAMPVEMLKQACLEGAGGGEKMEEIPEVRFKTYEPPVVN